MTNEKEYINARHLCIAAFWDVMRVFFVIHGAVQGVGYRQLVRSAALRNGIVGFVRNVRDGSVEALAQGGRENLDRFGKEINVSVAGGAQVFSIERIEEEDARFPEAADQYNDFKVEGDE